MENKVQIKQENIEELFNLVAKALNKYIEVSSDYQENGGIERANRCDVTRKAFTAVWEVIEVLGIENEYFDWKRESIYKDL